MQNGAFYNSQGWQNTGSYQQVPYSSAQSFQQAAAPYQTGALWPASNVAGGDKIPENRFDFAFFSFSKYENMNWREFLLLISHIVDRISR